MVPLQVKHPHRHGGRPEDLNEYIRIAAVNQILFAAVTHLTGGSTARHAPPFLQKRFSLI